MVLGNIKMEDLSSSSNLYKINDKLYECLKSTMRDKN